MNFTGRVPKKKRVRRAMTVSTKLDIIKRLERGVKSKDICATFNLKASTVRSIFLQKEKLREVARGCGDDIKKIRFSRARDIIVDQLESQLAAWADSLDVHVTYGMIKPKALELFEVLKKKAMSEGVVVKDLDFKASHGWYENYRRRLNSKRKSLNEHHFKKKCENVLVDHSEMIHDDLDRIVKDYDFSPQQIFTLHETEVFWKRMPSKTFIARSEDQKIGSKVSKDRLVLLLGGNLSSDIKLTPLLSYQAENPKTLKGCDKSELPFIWKTNKKVWITKELISDYVCEYFASFVEMYCEENNLENKSLLLVNSLGNPFHIEDFSNNVTVVFIPANSSSSYMSINPSDMYSFKAYYLELVFNHILNEGGKEIVHKIEEIWRDYNMKMAIDFLNIAWNKISEGYMKTTFLDDSIGTIHMIEEFQNKNLVEMAHKIGFKEVDDNDIHQLLNSASNIGDLCPKPQEEFTSPTVVEEDNVHVEETFEDDKLEMFLNTCDAALQMAEEFDPVVRRVCLFKNQMTEALECYRELFKNKKEQKFKIQNL